MNNKQLKSEIRQQVRSKRQLITPSDSAHRGFQLNQQLISNNLLTPHQHITCFLSFDGEISTEHVIQGILNSNKNCYLPKLHLKTQSTPNQLSFLPYINESSMVNNQYGIPEVDLNNDNAIDINKIDLVLFPLVAFDLFGNRLGMGGGFYDATFASLINKIDRPKFIGLAHDFQQVESVPKEQWDLPLDGICTQSRYLNFDF